jgi:GDP-L-fucose synthase
MGFWSGRRVLVTGGAGFIGSHAVERLLDLGATVTVVGRDPAHFRENLGQRYVEARFLALDLTEPDASRRACLGQEAVIHLASRVAGVSFNVEHPGTMFTSNALLGINILDAAARAGVERALVVSSACVYRRFAPVPTPETEGFVDDPEPTNFGYGWAKRLLEVQARAYIQEFPIKVAIARPYNAYGPRDDFDPRTSHVIAALVRRVVDGEDPIRVWGDGSQSRSFLYVSDFVDGLLATLERYAVCDPVNIGTDEEVTIGELIRMIVRLAGSSARIEFDATKPAGQPRRSGDLTVMRERVGFTPRVRLEEGLARTIEWYRAHRARSRQQITV